MRDGGYLNLYYFDPATDYVTNLQGWLHSLQVVAPWAASGYTPQDGEALTAWLYDDLGTLLASTGDDRDESPNAYWFDDFGVYDIQPGYWVTVTGGSGWSAGVQVSAMTIQGDQVWLNWGNTWIKLKQQTGFFDSLFQKWIAG